MDSFLIFLFLLIVLFLFSKTVTQSLGMLIYSLVKIKKIAVFLMALIFLPGTAIHELSHLIAAQFLRLETGKVSLWPQIEDKSIKLGSVKVEQGDIFRNFLVGVAPLIIGLALIFTFIKIYEKFLLSGFWPEAVLFYVLFQIGNTMFSSKRDMEGAVELAFGVFLVLGLLYLAGFKQVFEAFGYLADGSRAFFVVAWGILFKIIILDILVISISKLLSVRLRLRS